jgi:Zn-dependent membrane protease YugP
MSYLVLIIVPMLLSMFIGYRFKSKFEKYSQMPLSTGLSGAEVAQRMLRENGITDVQVTGVDGKLTDHYNPANKTVNLSPEVYSGRSIAAAAVAAHECGHAVQHARAYSFLKFRSAMVPALSVSSKFMPFLLMGGVMALSATPIVLMVGVVLFSLTTLFSFVTLPVEFDATNRALAWLETARITQPGEEHTAAKNALSWAASTYVIAALASLSQLIYYALMLTRNRD